METSSLYKEFGNLIREFRLNSNLTQAELADRVRLSRTSVTNVELGRQKILLHQLFSFAEALEVAPERLLPRADVAQPGGRTELKLPKDLTPDERAFMLRVHRQATVRK